MPKYLERKIFVIGWDKSLEIYIANYRMIYGRSC